ncbi:MAG: zinc ribbon domain-containing protein [Phycisphaerales bacterium]|nr:MAG: zinc ribbon domain-containing protein [Phycisphaerales bacterium]
MPTYDYECESCGYRFEQFQSITAKPTKKCPECGELKLQRLIGAGAGVIFKGSGFYQTDYRSESYKEAQKKETKPDTDKDTTKKKEDTRAKDSTPSEKAKPTAKDKKKSA